MELMTMRMRKKRTDKGEATGREIQQEGRGEV
jgi:hypothetical protein